MSCECERKAYVRRVAAAVARDEVRRLLGQSSSPVLPTRMEMFHLQLDADGGVSGFTEVQNYGGVKPQDFATMVQDSERFWFYRGEWRRIDQMRGFREVAKQKLEMARHNVDTAVAQLALFDVLEGA